MKRSRSSADLDAHKEEEKQKRTARSLTPPRWDVDMQRYTTKPPKTTVAEIFKPRAERESVTTGMIMHSIKPKDVLGGKKRSKEVYSGPVGERKAEDVVGSWPI